MPDQDMRNERRSEIRKRTLKGGKIVFNNRASVMTCTIRDLSQSGARLCLASTVGLPDRFSLLHEGDDASWECRVVWRAERQLGIQFIKRA